MKMKDYQEYLIAEIEDLHEKFHKVVDNRGTWPDLLKGRVYGLKMAYRLADGAREDIAKYDIVGFAG